MLVGGCLEGIFAHGHTYVLFSRVTDPECLRLIGLPPKDMLLDVVEAWEEAGLDVRACLQAACSCTDEWEVSDGPGDIPAGKYSLRRKFNLERTIPISYRTLEEIMNPQPELMKNMKRLLDLL